MSKLWGAQLRAQKLPAGSHHCLAWLAPAASQAGDYSWSVVGAAEIAKERGKVFGLGLKLKGRLTASKKTVKSKKAIGVWAKLGMAGDAGKKPALAGKWGKAIGKVQKGAGDAQASAFGGERRSACLAYIHGARRCCAHDPRCFPIVALPGLRSRMKGAMMASKIVGAAAEAKNGEHSLAITWTKPKKHSAFKLKMAAVM